MTALPAGPVGIRNNLESVAHAEKDVPQPHFFLRVRILKLEAGVNQGILPVRASFPSRNTCSWIDEDLDVFERQNIVGRTRLGVELEL